MTTTKTTKDERPSDSRMARDMIRCTTKSQNDDAPRTRTLSPRAFAEEILSHASRGFEGMPAGVVVVEYLGPDGRVHWQAHHTTHAGLVSLARELLEDEASEEFSLASS